MKALEFSILSNLLTPIITAVLSGVMVKRFLASHEKELSRSQKSWEFKREEYCRIIDALTDITKYNSFYYSKVIHEENYSEDYLAGLASLDSTARNVIDKATNKGKLVIAEEAAASLTKLRNTTRSLHSRNGNWIECLEIEMDAQQKCLDEIRECAERDINTNKPSLRPKKRFSLWKRRRVPAVSVLPTKEMVNDERQEVTTPQKLSV